MAEEVETVSLLEAKRKRKAEQMVRKGSRSCLGP
jgi:hypothetical protein